MYGGGLCFSMVGRPAIVTLSRSSAASDVYQRQPNVSNADGLGAVSSPGAMSAISNRYGSDTSWSKRTKLSKLADAFFSSATIELVVDDD